MPSTLRADLATIIAWLENTKAPDTIEDSDICMALMYLRHAYKRISESEENAA